MRRYRRARPGGSAARDPVGFGGAGVGSCPRLVRFTVPGEEKGCLGGGRGDQNYHSNISSVWYVFVATPRLL